MKYRRFIIGWAFTCFVHCLSFHLKDDLARGGKIKTKVLEGSPHTILRIRLSWLEGDHKCHIKLGTRLAELPTLEAAKNLATAIRDISVWNNTKSDYFTAEQKYEFGLDRRYWIGLGDAATTDGTWIWRVDDPGDVRKLNYSYWYTNQPDHVGQYFPKNREHCVALWNPNFFMGELHTFNDIPCDKTYYVICENPTPKP